MEAPLKGITVVEMSTFVAGPVTGRLLADMGARVIKVERPDGDQWRQTGKSYLPDYFSDDENPVFDIYNAGKSHVSLNLKTEAGKEAFWRLMDTADVFVTNTRPAALKRLGLDPEALRAKYPALVYALLLGYGEKGPDADLPAFDTTAFWARSGFLRDQSVWREDYYMPVQPPYSMGDTISGYLLTMEICSALYRRERTGEGDLVRSGLYHNSIFTMGTMAIITQQPWGWIYPTFREDWGAPGGAYRCADGDWVYFASYSHEMMPRFLSMMGREQLHEEPRFNSPAARWENRKEYYEEFRDAFMQQPAPYWLAEAKKWDLPLVRLGRYREICKDPQAWANGYVEEVTFRSGRKEVMPTSPIEMESVGVVPTVPAPAIGADTRSILAELGYSPEELDAMEQAGAVFSHQ